MPRVGSEPMIPLFEWVKPFHASDQVVTQQTIDLRTAAANIPICSKQNTDDFIIPVNMFT
jgi:hypothetical protein